MFLSSMQKHLPVVKIQEHEYQLQCVPGDGFFHCLSVCAANDYSLTLFINQNLQGFKLPEMLFDWDNFQDKVTLFHYTNMTQQSYLNYMVNSNGWATNVEIEAASILLGCSINVWLKCEGSQFILQSFGLVTAERGKETSAEHGKVTSAEPK